MQLWSVTTLVHMLQRNDQRIGYPFLQCKGEESIRLNLDAWLCEMCCWRCSERSEVQCRYGCVFKFLIDVGADVALSTFMIVVSRKLTE